VPSRSSRARAAAPLDWTDWLSYVYLALGLFLMFGPVLWLVMSSFKTESALTEFPPSFLPYGQKQVMVPGEDKPRPVYRVKLPDGSVRELPELRRIGLMATHVDLRQTRRTHPRQHQRREPVGEFRLADGELQRPRRQVQLRPVPVEFGVHHGCRDDPDAALQFDGGVRVVQVPVRAAAACSC